MKKSIALAGIAIIIFCICLYVAIPPLPFNNRNPIHVILETEGSDEAITNIKEEQDYNWFLTKLTQKEANIEMIKYQAERGWMFVDQLGSGLIFQNKHSEKMVIESQMWTGRYVLYRVPVSDE
ncbi:hypothetical protein [Rossellomorea sp. BNER]|uniref:hypothetical protein n=1 Tax=Rossellomorea sp. BNER TaxID=2962031 RepID=UPI003AF2FCA5|nr:hypothetical protein [Rossellomorea sp. BNER]